MIVAHQTLAQASRDLAAKIVARWGTDPEILADLHFGAMATPHLGTDRIGTTIFCHPRSGIREPDELVVAYYGQTPVFLDA